MKTEAKKRHSRPFVLLLAIGAAVVAGQACAPAVVGAGAGAAGVAYFTSRGAKAVVKGSPDHLEQTSAETLSQKAIPITDQKIENGGAHRELKGTNGGMDVTVTIDRRDDSTSEIEVSVRKNAVAWDKQYAESLLNAIIRKT
jgi:hypothetical protein